MYEDPSVMDTLLLVPFKAKRAINLYYVLRVGFLLSSVVLSMTREETMSREITNVVDLFERTERKRSGGAPLNLSGRRDPLADEQIKALLARYYSSGVQRCFTDPDKLAPLIGHLDSWAEELPEDVVAKYGACAPVWGIRAPRPMSEHEWAFSHSNQQLRYLHILVAAWASAMPLTAEMHRDMLDGWYRPEYDAAIELFLRSNLMERCEEDWSDTPMFFGKSTNGPHHRPTRKALYHQIETIMFLLDALEGVYAASGDILSSYMSGSSWPSTVDPMPTEDVSGVRAWR